MRFPHDRVTVMRFWICDFRFWIIFQSKISDLKFKIDKSDFLPQTYLPLVDVSRQNIAGRHELSILIFWNALFFWSMYVDCDKTRRFWFWGRSRKLKLKKIKSGKVLTVMFFAVAVFAGCRSNVSIPNTNAPATVAMRQVTDDLGRTVAVPVKITRVVSLAPNLTENIFAVGAGDRLVGVTTFCNYPEAAKSIAKIGDTMNPNMESIIALKPDVVFVSTASQIEAFMKTLEANKIAVYVTKADSLDALMKNLSDLGDIFGSKDISSKLISDLTTRINTIQKTAGDTRTRVFVQISKEPLFTIGNQSFLTTALGKAAAESVTRQVETAYPKLSKETALALDPEAIILSDSEDNREPNEVFKNSPAVKNGRVYKVNADLLSRPGPRLVDALEQIAKDLHPEKFPNK